MPEFAGGPQRRFASFGGYLCVSLLFAKVLLLISPQDSSFCCFLLFRGGQPAIITSTTLQVVVPSSLVPTIHGEDGECLKQIRQVQFIF